MDVRVVHDALVVTPDKGQQQLPIENLLRDHLGLPDAFVRQLLNSDRVVVGGRPLHLGEPLSPGHKVWLQGGIEETSDLRLSEVTRHAALDILYEDDHVLVVNKPYGLLVHPGDATDVDTLDHRVVAFFTERGHTRRPYHIHRLDRDTTGLVLYAKHTYSARTLSAMMERNQIHRTYYAIVRGRPIPRRGTIDEPIGRDRHVSGRYRVSKTGKPASTSYEMVQDWPVGNTSSSLVRCELETGRTHQIRVHLSSIGCPVVGDALYGGGEGVGTFVWSRGYGLHARHLSFVHPYLRDVVRVTASWPAPFLEAASEFGLSLEDF